MKNSLTALIKVATELAELALNNMPKLKKGESIIREWLKDGIYCQERLLDGKTYLAQFDFKQRVGSMTTL